MVLNCGKQRRRYLRVPAVRRSARGSVWGVRSLPNAFGAIFLTLMLWQYMGIIIPKYDGAFRNLENFEMPGATGDQNSRTGARNSDFEYSRNAAPIAPAKLARDNTLLTQILTNSRLPETKDHLMRLQLSSKIDVKELGIRLATADVYKPGSWDGAGIVIEEFKLVFFTQGKVACTVFKQLFRRMMHLDDWKKDNAQIPHHPKKNGLTYLYHYSIPDALTILTHSNWTRAIFVRDPKERTLSAFLDKAARKNGNYVKRHCCNQENSTCGKEASASFMGFLRVIEESCCCDPHWKSQTKRIDRAFMQFINFVGHFDRIQVDTQRLLKSLNSNIQSEDHRGIYDDDVQDLWIRFGASGWGTHGNESIFSKDTKAKHQTSAITKLRQYYNSSSEALVEKLFAEDYSDPLLNFNRISLFSEGELKTQLT